MGSVADTVSVTGSVWRKRRRSWQAAQGGKIAPLIQPFEVESTLNFETLRADEPNGRKVVLDWECSGQAHRGHDQYRFFAVSILAVFDFGPAARRIDRRIEAVVGLSAVGCPQQGRLRQMLDYLQFKAEHHIAAAHKNSAHSNQETMTTYKVVVDGSNIATEGRSLPSLTQLDEAVQAFIEEHPGADVLVIVDSSFPNRIDSKELPIFEAAYAAGEIITPPAGTIGRGDSFILKVADKLKATVFSNDSFQEFHGTYDWLFEKGRLEGGKPIPGYGWVFTPRTPVRGPKSREAVRESKRSVARIGSPEAMQPMPVPKTPPPFLLKADGAVATAEAPAKGGRGRRGKGRVVANGVAADSVVPHVELRIDAEGERKKKKKKRKRKGGNSGVAGSGGAEGVGSMQDLPAVNEPLAFINFISQHLLGSELEGVVSTYSSHGFYVDAAGAQCYVPLSGLATPMPRSAKEVVRKGDSYSWVVTGFDSARRGIELALVGTPAAIEFGLNGPAEAALVEVSDSDSSVESPVAKGPRRGSKPGPRRSGRSKTAGGFAEAPVGASVEAVESERSPAEKGKSPRKASTRTPNPTTTLTPTTTPTSDVAPLVAAAAVSSAAPKARASKSTAVARVLKAAVPVSKAALVSKALSTSPTKASAPKSSDVAKAPAARKAAVAPTGRKARPTATLQSAKAAVPRVAARNSVVPTASAVKAKAVTAKAPAKVAGTKTATKTVPAVPTKVTSARAAATRVTAAKTVVEKKGSVAKAELKKTAVTKTAVAKTAVTKTAITKTAIKTVARAGAAVTKAPVKKAPAKKTAVKTTAGKTTPVKAALKKAALKKNAVKKVAVKRA